MMNWRDTLQTFIRTAVSGHLTSQSEQASQPTCIRTALRPHQLTLLAAARALEQRAHVPSITVGDKVITSRYGVLADRVGAGKSLVALSLVGDPAPQQTKISIKEGGSSSPAQIISFSELPSVVPFPPALQDISGELVMKNYSGGRGRKIYTTASLLILPHNILNQWASYVDEHTQGLRVYIVRKTKDCDYDRPGFFSDIFQSDLVIVSSTMLRKFIASVSLYEPGFRGIVWSRVFVDEADSIVCTLPASEISARFTWLITASWCNVLFPTGLQSYSISTLAPELQNILGHTEVQGLSVSPSCFIRSTVATSMDPLFTTLILRNSDEWVNTSLEQPMFQHETIMCRTPPNLTLLREFISPAAMEALHAGDTAGALAALGLKASSKDTLVDRVTASLRGDLIQSEKILAFKRDIEYSTAAAKATAIEKAEQKVARLREQLASLESRVASSASDHCPICYDVPNTRTLTPCCRNAFCLACLCECIASKPACPLCRVSIDSVTQLMVVDATPMSVMETEVVEHLPSKSAALLKLLAESSPDQRFLVFSAHEASFRGLRELLTVHGVQCELLSGSGARIDRLRERFASGDVRVLCMNARHVGAGINLEATTDVVLYHRMNTELEKQVIGRAVRFERKRPLRVVHLVHEQETLFNGSHASEVIMHV
jgi:SNF2 family DNA or RNA helicase